MKDVERGGTEGRLEQDGGKFIPRGGTHPFVGPLAYLVVGSGMDLLEATNVRLPSSKLKKQLSPVGGVGDTPYVKSQNAKRMHSHQRDTRQEQARRNYLASEGSGGSGGRKKTRAEDGEPVYGDESASTRQARMPALVRGRLTTEFTG